MIVSLLFLKSFLRMLVPSDVLVQSVYFDINVGVYGMQYCIIYASIFTNALPETTLCSCLIITSGLMDINGPYTEGIIEPYIRS